MDLRALGIERPQNRRPKRGVRDRRFAHLCGLAILAGLVWVFSAPLLRLVDRLRLPTVRVMRVVESHPASAGMVRGTAANGHIVATRRAALSADNPGRIVEMNVTEGLRVRQGEIVARLYSDEYAAALRHAEAELESASVSVERLEVGILSAEAELDRNTKVAEEILEQVREAEANQKLAQQEFDRVTDLVKRGISSHADSDLARSALDARSAQLRAATARLRGAEASISLSKARMRAAQVDLEVAQADVRVHRAARDLAAATLAKTEVRAPFDGIVVLKDAEVGEVVSPNSQGGSNARGSVCTMVDFASLEVQAEVPETSLSGVELDAPATIYLDGYPEQAFSGRVDRIWPTANRQKATIEVRIIFDQLDKRMRPEMGVRVVFSSQGAREALACEPAILVPQEAVVETQEASGVFVLERDVARFQQVELGGFRTGRVPVRSGLNVGQMVVIDPPLSLRSGDRVLIREQ